MATRQYIGARYVPKFYVNSVDGSAQWEANVVYEPLVYVTLQNGHMYISKKQVPATVGTPASNPEYWLDFGSYNGFIEHLQEQIDTLDSDVSSLSERMSNRTIIYIGDSYMYGPGTLTVSIDNMLRVAHSYNFSYGGTGFIKDTDGKSFLHQLQNAVASQLFNNGDVTDIIIAGGINDEYSNSLDDYVTALNAMKTVIETNFAKARVWIIPMLWKNTGLGRDDQSKYYKLFRACLNTGYAVYPDAYNILIGLDSSYMQDAIHPSTKGCNLIANYIGSWINGGISNDERIDDFTITLDGTGTAGGQIVVRNGFIYLYVFLYLRGYNYTANEKILDLPDIFYQTNTDIKIACNYTVSAGTYSGGLYIKNAKLYADTAIGSADIHVNAIMPIGYIY